MDRTAWPEQDQGWIARYRAVRHGASVDVDGASTLVAASVAVGLVGWRVGRACLAAGRPAATTATLVAAFALVVAGIAWASSVGPDRVVLHDTPVRLLGAALLVPGAVLLVVARRMTQPDLRTDWDDTERLRRFRTGLRARLVPAAAARGHVAEIEQALHAGAGPAHAEFGHPLVLVREIAGADRTARARRWWATTAAGTGVPVAALLLGGALLSLRAGWGDRPGADRR